MQGDMMSDFPKILETEYSFLIPNFSLALPFIQRTGRFALISEKRIELQDYLSERKNVSLMSEHIGFRVRKVNGKYEFTYKKFLGRDNDLSRYDEHTVLIAENYLGDFLREDFHLCSPVNEGKNSRAIKLLNLRLE